METLQMIEDPGVGLETLEHWKRHSMSGACWFLGFLGLSASGHEPRYPHRGWHDYILNGSDQRF